jgi:hypothetical protein
MHPGKTAVARLTVLSTEVCFGTFCGGSGGIVDGFNIV